MKILAVLALVMTTNVYAETCQSLTKNLIADYGTVGYLGATTDKNYKQLMAYSNLKGTLINKIDYLNVNCLPAKKECTWGIMDLAEAKYNQGILRANIVNEVKKMSKGQSSDLLEMEKTSAQNEALYTESLDGFLQACIQK